jgi:hypothetical protein
MNTWADTEGTIELKGRSVDWKVRWYKDLQTGNTDIDEIMEVTVWKDYTGELDTEYYEEHRNELDDKIIEAAYNKGEPDFDESVTWSEMKECLAEMEE